MLRHLFLFSLLLPCAAWADSVPLECQTHVLDKELPYVSPTEPQHEKLLCYEEFALMHSSEYKTPIWVAEDLTPERVEAQIPRKDAFHPESRLEKGERAELSDYKKSGYARGHMAPSGDMATPSAQRESFSLANMVPQNSRNNSGPWKGIEDGVRNLAEHSIVFVVSGPIYLSSTQPHTIGSNKVAVPDFLYKAIYQPQTHLVGAYILSNEAKPSCSIVSIHELGERTGVIVFPTLPPELRTTPRSLPLPSSLSCTLRNAF